MVQSFTLGMITAFFIRTTAMKSLKWPVLSKPLRIVPQLIIGGVVFSLLDYARRVSLETTLKKEEMVQVATLLRKSQINYGSNAE